MKSSMKSVAAGSQSDMFVTSAIVSDNIVARWRAAWYATGPLTFEGERLEAAIVR
jgi:hypothetical protein